MQKPGVFIEVAGFLDVTDYLGTAAQSAGRGPGVTP